jgi:hypothetical protein
MNPHPILDLGFWIVEGFHNQKSKIGRPLGESKVAMGRIVTEGVGGCKLGRFTGRQIAAG